MVHKLGIGSVLAALTLLAGFGQQVHADIPTYLMSWEHGDEPNWFPAGPGTSTTVASGGGVLGLTAPLGTHYVEAGNLENDYQAGNEGDAGFTYLGGLRTYTGKFYQAYDIYIDPATWTVPTPLPTTPAVWMDMSPAKADASGSNTAFEYSFEYLVPTNGTILVKVDGVTLLTTITTAGWYTFAANYSKTGNQTTDPVSIDFTAWDTATSLQLGSTINATTGASSALGGNGYEWVTAWQNGFANDVIGLDGLRTGLGTFVAPEPASLALLAAGGLMLIRRRRQV